jgi:hypothetical protein
MDFFRFLSDFIDSVFFGWRGKLALISFGVALSFLAIWGMVQSHLPSEPRGLWRTERFWFVITPFTLLAGYTLISNLRKEKSPVKKQADD